MQLAEYSDQPARHCTAHEERTGELKPVYSIGLCRDCFLGKPIDKNEELGSHYREIRRMRWQPIPEPPKVKAVRRPAPPKKFTGTITATGVLMLTAEQFGMTVGDLKAKSHAPQVVFPRRVALYLLRDVLTMSFPAIAKMFSQHHTTVIHNVRKAELQARTDARFQQAVEKVREQIGTAQV